MMTVLVPLAKRHREAFNLTGAWAWVNATYGNGYGYPNFLMGWLDSAPRGNLPSFPPSFGDKSKDRNARALTFEAMELFLWRINDVAPHVVSFFVGQALNHRVGTWNSNGGLGFAEVLQAAGAAQSLGSLLVIPEQDRWRYNTTRRGVPGSMLLPAQVCSTLGMNILRHAGVFKSTSEDFQATEIQCWDAYSLALWDSDRVGDGRPAICKQADPLNNLCQLSGNYTFYLQQAQNGGFNTRVPYAHMNEKCWTLNPAPYNHQGCTKP
jgi:hypothetical protein